jgi:hypothetical protein
MFQKICRGEAPSTAASCSTGSDCRAARNSSTISGVFCQTSAMMIETSDQFGSESQRIKGK